MVVNAWLRTIVVVPFTMTAWPMTTPVVGLVTISVMIRGTVARRPAGGEEGDRKDGRRRRHGEVQEQVTDLPRTGLDAGTSKLEAERSDCTGLGCPRRRQGGDGDGGQVDRPGREDLRNEKVMSGTVGTVNELPCRLFAVEGSVMTAAFDSAPTEQERGSSQCRQAKQTYKFHYRFLQVRTG